jgi:hypothetical protein
MVREKINSSHLVRFSVLANPVIRQIQGTAGMEGFDE